DLIYFPMPPRKGAPTPLAAAAAPAPTDASAVGGVAVTTDASVLRDSIASQDSLPPGFRPASSEIIDAMTPPTAAVPATPGKAKAEIFGATLRLELPYTKLPAAAVYRRGL